MAWCDFKQKSTWRTAAKGSTLLYYKAKGRLCSTSFDVNIQKNIWGRTHKDTIAVDKVVVHSGNGATQSAQVEDLCAAAVMPEVQSNDRHTARRPTQSKNHVDQPARCFCSSAALFTELSACLLYDYSPCPSCSITWVNMNVLNPQHMSQIIKCYIQDQGCYGHLRGAVEITLVICSPGSKQSGNIWG